RPKISKTTPCKVADMALGPNAAFVLGMIPHHQGAVDMAEIVLKCRNRRACRNREGKRDQYLAISADVIICRPGAALTAASSARCATLVAGLARADAGRNGPSVRSICPTKPSIGRTSWRSPT